METVQQTKLFLLTCLGILTLAIPKMACAQAAVARHQPELARPLAEVYNYWRNAMIQKNYNAWSQVTASHRKMAIQNRILSEKAPFPATIFDLPARPPSLQGLKLLRARNNGLTAKAVYFGKIDFGVGGVPTQNLLVVSYIYEGKGWKYDAAEFVNLEGLKAVRKQILAGNLKYVDGEAFLPDGKIPQAQPKVGRAKYIAKVYSFCPGREVKATVNGVSKHRFQDTQQSEVVIGGGRDGVNRISYQIRNLPGYQGKDPLTLRVYIFSQINGVKPIKVFQYQVPKGQVPKGNGQAVFNITPQIGQKVLKGR